ncbi:hypothetical protein BST81_12740 [Leptolyngbya sp. 'hensonii']|uniref:hypothetical protein n=1 Tax=Leptolyngbya sp. 'hensonii' TaxID=1922337 RepID=UPI00094F59D9|nr:hypothetical protein [Leptolyngbya sp. 'hensonii']OLP17919.1 hypothetical protein BST81_12740 [Leptolyngbya sp. 'hensonii']
MDKVHPQSVLSRNLDYQEAFTCPICRHGQITGITLMDAFACNFCHHIFTANLVTQSVHVVDISQPMGWRWTGRSWQPLHQGNTDLTWLIWLVGVILVTFPPLLIGLTSYIFPTLGEDTWDFPLVWTSITFLLHLLLVLWLIAEHHQFPPYVSLKVRLGNRLSL